MPDKNGRVWVCLPVLGKDPRVSNVASAHRTGLAFSYNKFVSSSLEHDPVCVFRPIFSHSPHPLYQKVCGETEKNAFVTRGK